MEISVKFQDGSIKQFSKGILPVMLLKEVDRSLAKAATAVKVNNKVSDWRKPLDGDCEIEFLTFADDEGKDAFRHSASHIMAQAVKRLYSDVKFGIGPAIANGFYYDMDTSHTFTPEDLVKIQGEMEKIVKENLPIERIEVSRDEALAMFQEQGEIYKVEIINDLPEDAVISLYRQGEFVDLCAGPHLPSTGGVKAIKLQSLAGAYWRGSEKNKMLQRIYGIAFADKQELADYLEMLAEAARRDHRKLGKELDLFSLQDEGPGFPFFHPKGMIIRNNLENLWREIHLKYDYDEIKTPMILQEGLWHKSGHWDHYRSNMYFTQIDEQPYAVKPMNCPGAMLVYKQNHYSYRDLPLRMAELGLVHRHELSGTLHGLMRVRCFTQDDAHIFMLPTQIKDEIQSTIEMFNEVYSTFGLSYHAELSTRPEKAMGSLETWEEATAVLRNALEERGMEYRVNEGDGAFYGPKIDFHLKDSIGRTWQCGTIQLDMQMPEKFDIFYIGEDGQKHRPVMIHRVVYGSIERFIGILTEHFAGAFPLWLAPVQVRLLPVTNRAVNYAEQLMMKMKQNGIRVEMDRRNEKIGYKIREGQLQKIPYLLVVGDKEEANETVAVRKRGEGEIGVQLADEFLKGIKDDIDNKIIW